MMQVAICYLMIIFTVLTVHAQPAQRTLLPQTQSQVRPQYEFYLPPDFQFHIPQYPAPMAQEQNILFPFYKGEAVWTSPQQQMNLYSKYEFNTGTVLQLNEFDLAQGLAADRYYSATVTSLPSAESRFFGTVQNEMYFVSGADLSRQQSLGGGRYSINSKTTLYQSTPVQNRAAITTTEAVAPECAECKKNAGAFKSLDDKATELKLKSLKAQILKDGQVPARAFNNAWNYFLQNKNKISNQDFLTVVDYTKPSDQPRLFVIDLKTGSVEKHLVAHGSNSSGTGNMKKYAVRYSNKGESKQSSHGAFITGETYNGKFGRSLRIDGQIKGLNDNARERAIVIHPWNVQESSKPSLAQDTWGCFGLAPGVSDRIINKVKNGSLWYVEPFT